MNINSRKKSAYNIISGVGSQIITIILGIVIPRLFLVTYGSEINGLLNSIGQFYTYLALLEVGVGAATLQALYKPVALDDKNKISEIMSATNKFYKRTGLIYLGAVIVLSLVYPLVVSKELNYVMVAIIFLINGIPGVMNFLFQGKYRILLQAEGKQYILTNLATVVTILTSLSKIILMVFGFNIIAVQIGYLLINLLQMIYIMLYMKKHYKWIDLNALPDFSAISQKNSVLIHEIGTLIFFNVDIIILTFFCDLKVVSIYSIYTLCYSMVSTFINSLSQGFAFVLGQKFNVDRKRYIELRDIYETYRTTLVFALFCIAETFIIPFMKLYTAGVNDINYIDKWLATLFVITYLLSCSRAVAAADINYAQHFKQTQWRVILETIINIVVSVFCVKFWGIYGVLYGTIAALLYRTNDMIIYANKTILNRSPWKTYKCWIVNLVLYMVLKGAYSRLNLPLDNYFQIIGWAIIIGVLTLFIFFSVISFLEPKLFKGAMNYIRGKAKYKS